MLAHSTPVDYALYIDCKMGTNFGEKAIRKEMKNARIASETIDGVTMEHIRTG